MNTGANGIFLLHHFEGCRLEAYPDPATGGAPFTIGYGDTGPDVVPGLKITQAEADQRFANRLSREFEPGVEAALTGGASQAQFDALVAFAFNVGLGNLKSSTLLRLHNAGDVAGAAAQFARWNKAAGKEMKGLSRRRAAEAAVYRGVGAQQAIKMALELFP